MTVVNEYEETVEIASIQGGERFTIGMYISPRRSKPIYYYAVKDERGQTVQELSELEKEVYIVVDDNVTPCLKIVHQEKAFTKKYADVMEGYKLDEISSYIFVLPSNYEAINYSK